MNNENNTNHTEDEAYRLWLKQASFVDVSYLMLQEEEDAEQA